MAMLRARPEPPKMGSLPRRLRNMISWLLPEPDAAAAAAAMEATEVLAVCYQRSKENRVFVRQILKFFTPKTIQSCATSFCFTRLDASPSSLTRLGAGSQKLGWLLVMT